MSCPNCDHELVKHSSAGKRQYKPYPELQVCPRCWFKYNPKPDGSLQRISKTGRPLA